LRFDKILITIWELSCPINLQNDPRDRAISSTEDPMSNRVKIILNPASGSGTGLHSKPQIEELLTRKGVDYDLVLTEGSWHAVDLTVEAARDGFDVVVSAGGDGTANEVINGLMTVRDEGGSAPALGILRAGRGNDFAHGIGIPHDLEEACDVLIADHRRVIDVGRVYGGRHPEGRYFGNCVGIGFDAVTTIEVSKLPRLGGFLSFLIAVLRTILLYHRGPMVEVQVDEHTHTLATLLVSVMNGQRLGDGFWMAPDGKFDDGMFDLCIAEQVTRRRILTLLPHFMRGTQASQPEIHTMRGAAISIRALDGVLPAQTDGEILCTDGDHLRIEIVPGHLEIVSPKESPRV
jgi:diacylglycerol kinase (ATP)